MNEPYKFSLILRVFVERRGHTWNEAAKLCGLSPERMEKLAQGQHVPLAPDIIRLSNGLGIKWKPEDFEERGLTI